MKKKDDGLFIPEVRMDVVTFNVLGTTPLIMHRMGDKAQKELLYPKVKTRADRATHLKHDPMQEFLSAAYVYPSKVDMPTACYFPSAGFSKGLASVALDIPGGPDKSQMTRLTGVVGINVPIYGIPSLGMDVVRQSGMTKAPDIRTRPYFAEWACQIMVRYYALTLNEEQISNLVQAAGVLRGLGDYRPEKGGQYGTYTIVNDDNPDFQRIMKRQGREAQLKALANPSFFSEEAAELHKWFEEERKKRAPSATRTKAGDALETIRSRPNKHGNGNAEKSAQ